MNKTDDKLNLFQDIGVFEYVSGEQSTVAKANFEEALSENQGLRHDVMLEKQLRSLVQPTQKPSPIAQDNINSLLDRIDAETVNESSINSLESVKPAVSLSRSKVGMGFAIAACLLLAVFVSININNDLLDPKFQTLSSSTPNSAIDLNALANERRLIKFELAEPLSNESIDSLMIKYELQRLSLSVDGRTITAQANKAVDEKVQLDVNMNHKEQHKASCVDFFLTPIKSILMLVVLSVSFPMTAQELNTKQLVKGISSPQGKQEWVVVLSDPRPARLQGWSGEGYSSSDYNGALELKRIGLKFAKKNGLKLKQEWLH